jgi:hypothetical protein
MYIQAHIGFTTHQCIISVNDDHINCFKYDDRSCDMDSFLVEEQDMASDFILSPLPKVRYWVNVDEE